MLDLMRTSAWKTRFITTARLRGYMPAFANAFSMLTEWTDRLHASFNML